MQRRVAFIILIFSVFLSTGGMAQVLMVTSNADAGPGTLRDALTKAAANGSTTVDQIHFNLPGSTEAERTITLLSELPHVKSKTIIDASTQPGPKFGRSDAKVAIRPDRTVYANPLLYTGGFFIDDADDVEIYGFYIYNFYDLINSFPKDTHLKDAAIYINSSNNVIIGAPGKGNVLVDNENSICADADETVVKSQRITIQSNWIGLKPDGLMPAISVSSVGIYFRAVNSIVGGDSPEKGNYIAGHSGASVGQKDVAVVFGGANAVFRFNKLGIDIDGKPSSSYANVYMHNYAQVTNALVADNIANVISIRLSYVKDFSVVRNRSMIKGDETIGMDFCYDGTIGTDRDEDVNVLFGSNVHSFLSERIQVLKNSIWCTTVPLITNGKDVPKIQVLVSNDTEYSGTASPGSEIYIYTDNSDCARCNPKEFYTKVMADAAGVWKLTGDFSAKKLVANATLLKASSEYTVPTITSVSGKQVSVVLPACDKDDGSISLLSIKHATKVEWYNSSDQKIGTGTEITDLGPGTYYAKLINGNCSVQSLDVKLTRPKITFMDLQLDVKQPACGFSNGYIKGLMVLSEIPGTPVLEWRDKSGNTLKLNDPEITGLGPGEYTLFVTTNTSCSAVYGPVVLTNVQSPVSAFPVYQTAITPASCGQNNGAVRVDVTGEVVPRTFKWLNAAGNLVGDKDDLAGVPAGDYRLFVSDESGCEGLYKTYTVNATNSLSIDPDGLTIIPDRCLSGKGAISGIRVVGGTGPYQYIWRDENNQIVGNTIDLTGVKAGSYKLSVTAAGTGCGGATRQFEVGQEGELLTPPTLNDLTICAPGVASLRINQPKTGTYRVYGNLESITALAESTNGILDVTVDASTTLYVTFSNGICESGATPVKITVFSNEIQIPNTISPNGDLVNDTWEIKGFGTFQPLVTIYNRYGQVVFRSKGYQTPFNGDRNGKPLPMGTYYYVISLGTDCRMMKGSVFVVR